MPVPLRNRSGARVPTQRRLRVFAFDPGVRAQLDTLTISELTLNLLWEPLTPGPVGEYVEVVDYDPASGAFYEPVDLDAPFVLAEQGLSPAEGGPQFHQQMVYAVAMNTIDQFERALGRVALWADRIVRDENGHVRGVEFVRRLRIYPHALREANAYYSPKKKALLFGYFPTRGGGPGQAPGGTVFTALSYDVVAHETTHALLDGLHPSFNEPTNPDVHALHEGFADVVALFQRFAHPEVLQHQIARTRGNLEQQNMLGELAGQFGAALGMRGALRDAIGGFNDATRKWEPYRPDPQKLAAAAEPHERGGVLLAAVFSAFLAIYKMRSADLFRIATNGTGVLGEGAIHPDLVRRLAREAASAAQSVLTMCIRGLDYCPPVDVDFGTYLRGVITADAEVWPQEKYAYRVAFAEAFRQWGVYPDGVRGMDESELRYPLADDPRASARCARYDNRNTGDVFRGDLRLEWDLTTDREKVAATMKENARRIHGWLTGPKMRGHLAAFGLAAAAGPLRSVYQDGNGVPTVEVHSVRLARRRGSRDSLVTDLVVEVRQRRRGYFDRDVQTKIDDGDLDHRVVKRDFRFRRGCTLIIDPNEERIRYAISTRGDVTDGTELERVRRFLTGQAGTAGNPFFGRSSGADLDEDDEHFAALHRRVAAAADF